MGMLDADEFVVIKDVQPGQRPNLPAFLKPFEAHGGLVVREGRRAPACCMVG